MGSRTYLLIALTFISMTSWADRAVFNLLAEPIKRDLHLSDTEIGLLGGIAYAALYAALSIPIARLAERKSRLSITVAAVTFWSVMTMVCAACSNFWQLALARAGVGVGESACLPCAQSMISDTYPPERRATAISVFSLGIPVGTVGGIVLGAWAAELYSWREAFVVAGAPGLVLAVVAAVTLKEPVRGRFDAPVSDTPPPLLNVLRYLWSQPAFRNLQIGAAIATMISAGIGAFTTPLLLRSKLGVDLSDLAWLSLLLIGVGSVAGSLAGGTLADMLARRDQRWTLWLPGFAFIIAAPAWAAAFLSNSLPTFIVPALIGQTAIVMFFAPTFGALNNMVEPRMRATAVAAMGVVNSLIGLGLGPVLVGTVSDLAASSVYGVNLVQCVSSAAPSCSEGIFLGLRFSLVAGALLFLWPAFHYLRAGNRLPESLLVKPGKPEDLQEIGEPAPGHLPA